MDRSAEFKGILAASLGSYESGERKKLHASNPDTGETDSLLATARFGKQFLGDCFQLVRILGIGIVKSNWCEFASALPLPLLLERHFESLDQRHFSAHFQARRASFLTVTVSTVAVAHWRH